MQVSTRSRPRPLRRSIPGTTAPFIDAGGLRLPGSIAQKLSVPINGVQQGMVIRGAAASNPVLLWVRGGLGMPDYPPHAAAPDRPGGLCTVVWWDQRGTSLSYDPDIPPATMTIEQFADDTLTLTDYLRERFRQDRIFLLGHPWGSLITLHTAARSPRSGTGPTSAWRRPCTSSRAIEPPSPGRGCDPGRPLLEAHGLPQPDGDEPTGDAEHASQATTQTASTAVVAAAD